MRGVAALAFASVLSTTHGCPSGSTPPPLEIVLYTELRYDDDSSFLFSADLAIVEPGGKNSTAGYGTPESILDVGAIGSYSEYDGWTDRQFETYMLFNGLSVDTDPVLGDYTVWTVNGNPGKDYTIAVRLGGELVLEEKGSSDSEGQSPKFTVTVTDYYDSDCTLKLHGYCPTYAISPNNRPPCTKCPRGQISTFSADFTVVCELAALQYASVPEAVKDAIVADAVGGFAGPGYMQLNGGGSLYDRIILDEGDANTLQLSGWFERWDGDVLPASIALFLYVYNPNSPTNVIRGQGEIDSSTGNFTATIDDMPLDLSKVALSFGVLDALDADVLGSESVFELDVLNGCGDALVITLEWDTDDTDLDLYVIEPSGFRARFGGGVGNMGDDVTDGFGPESYTLLRSSSVGDAMLGDYTAFVRPFNTSTETEWTLTATINGEVVWIEEGYFEAQAPKSFSSIISSTSSASGTSDSYSFDFQVDDGGSYSFEFPEFGSSSSSVIEGGNDGDSRSYSFDYFFDQVVDDNPYASLFSSSDIANSSFVGSTSAVSITSSTPRQSELFVVTLEVEDVSC